MPRDLLQCVFVSSFLSTRLCVAPFGAFFLLDVFAGDAAGLCDILFPHQNSPDFVISRIFVRLTNDMESDLQSVATQQNPSFLHYRAGYPHVRAVLPWQPSSEFLSMLYNELMTRMDPGLMIGMTRGSLALCGTGENCIWHRQGNKARGARARREQPLPRPPRRLCCRPCRKSSCWPWSAPWHATPPVPIMPPSNRAEGEPPSRSGSPVGPASGQPAVSSRKPFPFFPPVRRRKLQPASQEIRP